MPPVTRSQARRHTLPRSSSFSNQVQAKRRLSDSEDEHRQLSLRKRRKSCPRWSSERRLDNSNSLEWFQPSKNDRNVQHKENMLPRGIPDLKNMRKREGFGHCSATVKRSIGDFSRDREDQNIEFTEFPTESDHNTANPLRSGHMSPTCLIPITTAMKGEPSPDQHANDFSKFEKKIPTGMISSSVWLSSFPNLRSTRYSPSPAPCPGHSGDCFTCHRRFQMAKAKQTGQQAQGQSQASQKHKECAHRSRVEQSKDVKPARKTCVSFHPIPVVINHESQKNEVGCSEPSEGDNVFGARDPPLECGDNNPRFPPTRPQMTEKAMKISPEWMAEADAMLRNLPEELSFLCLVAPYSAVVISARPGWRVVDPPLAQRYVDVVDRLYPETFKHMTANLDTQTPRDSVRINWLRRALDQAREEAHKVVARRGIALKNECKWIGLMREVLRVFGRIEGPQEVDGRARRNRFERAERSDDKRRSVLLSEEVRERRKQREKRRKSWGF